MFNNTGTLVVRTFTAGGALPVKNAVIKIKGAGEENSDINYSILTDIDGATKIITLPAPPRALSVNREATEIPYAIYDIEVAATGFYPKKIFNVVVFEGIETLQPVNMIPSSFFDDNTSYPQNNLSTTIYENENL